MGERRLDVGRDDLAIVRHRDGQGSPAYQPIIPNGWSRLSRPPLTLQLGMFRTGSRFPLVTSLDSRKRG